MPNLTIRDIPTDVLNKIKFLSQTERRSINSEILLILEKGLKNYIYENASSKNHIISKETQLEIWANLSGKWEDNRETESIIDDIYSKRTKGRDVILWYCLILTLLLEFYEGITL